MDLLGLQSHLQDSARRAAGSFLSPLTNAIGEQRRLIDSLAVVSKVRVEECKHMMDWSKTQTDDLGDVLLKLNLLIRKISDYEIRFGTQYESFREKIKYLRTKDDSLCEMGRRQSDLQQKILEASKSRLRTAKAKLLQTELDQIQKESAPTETKLQHLKRQLIKGAYTEELNAIIELGKKMQIIGEHGMQLLDHIDLPLPPGAVADGRKTEDILQAARIALENWDQLIMVDPQSVVVHPPPPPPPARSMSEVSQASLEEIQTLAVKESRTATASTDSASEPEDSDSDVEFVQAPTSPLKAKPSVALSTDQKTGSSPDSLQVNNAAFASTLVPKLTLTPNKNSKVTQSGPTLPPRTSDWASEAAEALASVQIKKSETKKNEPLPTKKLEALPLKIEDTTESEAETLRRLEELEIKHALELSLAEAAPPTPAAEDEELRLTAEELRFVMGDVVPKRSTKVIKRQARAPETTDGDTPAISKQASSRMARAGTKINTDLAASASASASEAESEDLETPKASKAPRVLRGPQATDPDATRVSQQGPRPWVEEDAESVESTTESEDIHEEIHEELSGAAIIPETLGDQGEAESSKKVDIPETMGPEPEKPLESMGQEPERPLESMGAEAEQPLESMGNDQAEEESVPFVPMPQVPSLDAIRQQKIAMKQQQQLQQQQQMAYTASPEPQHQSVQNSPQPMHQHTHPSPQPSLASLPTPKTAYAQISSYQSPIPYQPSTAYVPQASKQKNRLSGSHTPPQQGNASPGSSPSPQHQQQHQHASGTYNAQYIQQQQQYLRQQQQQLNDFYYQPHEQEYNQQQYQLYQQQLREQRQREGSVSSISSSGSNASLAPLGWNIPRVNQQQPNPYQQQYEQQYQQQQYQQYQQQQQQQQQQYHQQQQQQQYHQQQQHQQHERPGSAAGSIYEDHQSTSSGAPSPSPSHISLVPDNSSSAAATPVMASVAPLTPQGKTPAGNKKPATSSHAPSPDDYKVEVK